MVAARGVPLSVTLLCPLWVVNATSLAIDAAIVQVPPPPPVSQTAWCLVIVIHSMCASDHTVVCF